MLCCVVLGWVGLCVCVCVVLCCVMPCRLDAVVFASVVVKYCNVISVV